MPPVMRVVTGQGGWCLVADDPAAIDEAVSQAHEVQDFERARMDRDGAGSMAAPFLLSMIRAATPR